ncbi:MAG: hypothetical protein GY797_35110 [Deltaproteobacteria bacterium]|nr:hypothetical protein [Deltaproteobacteria bacterium]
MKKHPGVIRLKVNPTTIKNIKDLLLPFLQSHKSKNFEDRLVIVKSTGFDGYTQLRVQEKDKKLSHPHF